MAHARTQRNALVKYAKALLFEIAGHDIANANHNRKKNVDMSVDKSPPTLCVNDISIYLIDAR